MSKKADKVVADIAEIKEALQRNTITLAEYNAQLAIHIKGVQDLDARVRPIEDHVQFVRKLLTFGVNTTLFLAKVAGGAVAIVTLYSLFLK